MGVRSKRLALGLTSSHPADFSLRYTVPTDRTAIIRTITAVNVGASSAPVGFTVAPDGSAHNWVLPRVTLAPDQGLQWNTWLVLEDQDELYAVTNSSSISVGVFGALLLGDPT